MKLFVFLAMIASPFAHAGYDLANNGKTVTCSADDNQSWVLSKKRDTVKYTVEGESLGRLKVVDVDTDGSTYASYRTDEGILTLSDKGDTYQFAEEDQAWGIDCE